MPRPLGYVLEYTRPRVRGNCCRSSPHSPPPHLYLFIVMLLVLSCHCEGTCARGNPNHGARTVSFPSSCLGLLRSARNDVREVTSLRGCSFCFTLSLRASNASAAIPTMEYVQPLCLSFALDCRVGLRPPRNDVVTQPRRCVSRVSCRPVPCVAPLCGRAVVLRSRNRANSMPRSSYCAGGLSGAVCPLRLSFLLLSW